MGTPSGRTIIPKLSVAILAFGCAMPATRPPAVSPAAVRAEQLKQQQLFIQSHLLQTQRLEDIGHPLLVAASGFCERYITVRAGVRFTNVYDFGPAYQAAAWALGFGDTLIVSTVAKGSAAERAGLRAGDRILTLQGRAAPTGRNALSEAVKRAADAASRRTPLSLTVVSGPFPVLDGLADTTRRDDHTPGLVRAVSIPGDKACPFGLALVQDNTIQAAADGRNIVVTTGLLRFASSDDELALVVAHEIAHNALRHGEGKQKNASLGGLLGAVLDVAAATQGIDTRGTFTKSGMRAGAEAFSQEFELEADYVGLYMLARAGRAIATAPRFWRQMAITDPRSIRYTTTHPTSAERFVRLEAAVQEVEQKLARGEIPSPELRDHRGVPVTQLAAGASRAANRPSSSAGAAALSPPPSTTTPLSPTSTRHDTTSLPAVTRRGTDATRAPGSTARVGASNTRRAPPGPVNAIPGDTTADRFVWVYGPPVPRDGMTLAQVKRKARLAWIEGAEAREVGWLERAREKFFEATQLDGTEATYHAALGSILLRQGLLVEAEAVISAAALLEPTSEQYRLLLAEVRLQRLRIETRRP